MECQLEVINKYITKVKITHLPVAIYSKSWSSTGLIIKYSGWNICVQNYHLSVGWKIKRQTSQTDMSGNVWDIIIYIF